MYRHTYIVLFLLLVLTRPLKTRDWASMNHSWQSRCATFTLRYQTTACLLPPFFFTLLQEVCPSFRRTPSSQKLAQDTTHRRSVAHHIRNCHGIQNVQCSGPLPGHSYYYIVRLLLFNMISINANMWIVGNVWMLDMEWTAMNIEIHTTLTKTHVIRGNHILETMRKHTCKKTLKFLLMIILCMNDGVWHIIYLKSLTTVGRWWHLAIVHKTCFNLQDWLEQMKKSRLHCDVPWCTNVISKAYPSCSNQTQCRSRIWP